MAAASTGARADNRTHSAVYHKRDRRVNDIIRRCRKSDIINLYDIDCDMLFRVEQAHIEFDMLQNHRPYILFAGNAEGVFLPEEMGLLFPNMCDQLDFRSDCTVPAGMQYMLSDLEIATLANNGLFNSDWSCQGRIIGSLLEIPCKVDYSAVSGTPITFIEIQDRLSLRTSTLKTGYKTLVTAFLPYSAQKHNDELRAEIREQAPYDKSVSEIRRRALYDTPAVGFGADTRTQGTLGGRTFVEEAQHRIQQRLQAQMAKADVLGLQSGKGKAADAKDTVAAAVATIQGQLDTQRGRALREAEESGTKVQTAVLDARLNDMAQKMIYAGAQEIPVSEAGVEGRSLADPKPAGRNDDVMTRPTTDVGGGVTGDPKAEIEDRTDRLHDAARDANSTAKAVADKAASRREKLAARRAEKAAAAERTRKAMDQAAKEEAAKGMDHRDPDRVTEVTNPETGETERAAVEEKDIEGDILSGTGVDIDQLIKDLGM